MSRRHTARLSFTVDVAVDAPAARAFQAFLSDEDLGYWWAARRSVAVPRPTGPFAITWADSDRHDEVLGRLGGTLHGLVVDVVADRELVLGDVYWQPPAGEPLGPMALEIACRPEADARSTRITVTQSAGERGPRWDRYFTVTRAGWQHALETLKDYLEHEWLYRVKALKQARP